MSRDWTGLFSRDFLSRFELAGVLGEGGQGLVLRGLQRDLGREVALKVFRGRELVEPARILRESRILASLKHPGIVSFYFAEVDGPHPVFVMELVRGSTLDDAMERGLPWEEALDLLDQLAQALDFAHGMGVVHRDIKPGNVFLAGGGTIKLADFGLARLFSDSDTVTEVNQIVGTPQYMSPEQLRGEPLGPASDRYSLAVMAFELLTGSLPWVRQTTNLMDLLKIRLNDPPRRLRDLRPDLPPGLDLAFHRALSTDPAQRHASAGELVSALRSAEPSSTSSTSLPAVASRTWVVVLMLLIVPGFLLWATRPNRQDPPAPSPDSPAPDPDVVTPLLRCMDVMRVSREAAWQRRPVEGEKWTLERVLLITSRDLVAPMLDGLDQVASLLARGDAEGALEPRDRSHITHWLNLVIEAGATIEHLLGPPDRFLGLQGASLIGSGAGNGGGARERHHLRKFLASFLKRLHVLRTLRPAVEPPAGSCRWAALAWIRVIAEEAQDRVTMFAPFIDSEDPRGRVLIVSPPPRPRETYLHELERAMLELEVDVAHPVRWAMIESVRLDMFAILCHQAGGQNISLAPIPPTDSTYVTARLAFIPHLERYAQEKELLAGLDHTLLWNAVYCYLSREDRARLPLAERPRMLAAVYGLLRVTRPRGEGEFWQADLKEGGTLGPDVRHDLTLELKRLGIDPDPDIPGFLPVAVEAAPSR